ncbi:ABC transporter permease [Proteobacteria bacterium 005FR1]|nr:ABC transporter permease [Proteobacteria bacterium 005FR1]
MLSVLGSIIGKELRDGLRDKRALMTLFFLPLSFLVVIYGVVLLIINIQEKSAAFELPVQGAQHAAPLMDWFREAGIQIVEVEGDPLALVESRRREFVLVVASDFPEKFRDFGNARLELVYDRSHNSIQGTVFRIKQLIQQWSGQIGSLRLIARGISPQVANPVVLEDVDVAKEQFAIIPLMLVMMMVVTIFMSSVGLSVDMMAGEREANSLEPLLLNPVSRELILSGKWIAAMACTAVVLLMAIAAVYILVPSLPLERLGSSYRITAVDLLRATLVALPLIALATALQLLVSIFAKSFKEAQTYISFLFMAPLGLAYYVVFTDSIADWQMWVPVLGSLTLMEAIFLGEPTSLQQWFAASGICLIVALALAAIVAKQLRRERIIYG